MYATAWIVFFIGIAWDLVLRFSYEGLFGYSVQTFQFIRSFANYFERHTLLSSSLIAGAVSSAAYMTIEMLMRITAFSPTLILLGVSAGFGFIMRLSGLFPHLTSTYYKRLGPVSILTDTLSGVIVASTYKLLKLTF